MADQAVHPNSLLDANPAQLMMMFPSVSKAQVELFSRLLGEPKGGARADALAQSLLATSFSVDQPRDARRRPGAVWASGGEVQV